MNQPYKLVKAHRPQINIFHILIAPGIGYFFLKGVAYFVFENSKIAQMPIIEDLDEIMLKKRGHNFTSFTNYL
jgi:hypothetical protein